MARIRMVKPQVFKHADLYEAEAASGLPLRLAFIGLWTVADRRGVFPWSRNIKPDVLPYDPCDMLAVLDALAVAGFVVRYEGDGKPYGFIPTFSQHQTFHKNEKASTLPAPPEHGTSTVLAPCEHSSRPATTTTASTTGTSTGTGTSAEGVVGEGESPVAESPSEYAIALTVTANQAITEKWGEQPSVLHFGTAQQLAADLLGRGVSLDVARASIIAQMERRRREDGPPRSIQWFRLGIERAWEQEQQRRLDATTALPAPARASPAGKPGTPRDPRLAQYAALIDGTDE